MVMQGGARAVRAGVQERASFFVGFLPVHRLAWTPNGCPALVRASPWSFYSLPVAATGGRFSVTLVLGGVRRGDTELPYEWAFCFL